MGWVFLGLITLPFAALAYAGFERVLPRLLQPAPEASTPIDRSSPDVRNKLRWAPSRRQTAVLRGTAAVVVLLTIAVILGRRQTGVSATAVAPAAPRAPETQLPPPIPLQVQLRFGTDGSGEGQLRDPRDVAVDPAGNIYLADTGNKRVVKFNPDDSPAAQWSSSAKGAFVEPSALAVVKDGVIVDDSETAQIHKFDFNGQPVAAFEHDLGLSHPRGIAAAPDGTIYVGDTANNRIVKLGSDGSPLPGFDSRGVKLEQPTGIAIDEQGSIYSIEPAASRIQKFAADGILQASFFLPPSVTLYPPRALWISGHGLVVSLPDQNELLAYGPAGAPLGTFVPEPQTGAVAPLRALGLAAPADEGSVWVVWNATGTITKLAWPR